MANMLCGHGDSGSGKTSFLGSLVGWMKKQDPNAVARLVTADNIDVLEPYIDAGWLEVWQIPLWDHPFEILDHACRGYWPQDPRDPTSKLLAPSAEMWGKYRLWMYEGLSHFSDMLMKRLADLGGEGTYIGPGTRPASQAKNKADDGADLIAFQDGEYGVGGNARAHYNVVQKEMRKNILSCSVMPVQTVWTAHTVKATEENTPIYGPQLAGKAATAKVQAWFSALLHFDTEVQAGAVKYMLYLKEHKTRMGGPIPYKAIQRIPLQLLDKKTQKAVEEKWDKIVPLSLEWTNDSHVAERYMDIRARMRAAAHQIILESAK